MDLKKVKKNKNIFYIFDFQVFKKIFFYVYFYLEIEIK
jgi:hypothetical protein